MHIYFSGIGGVGLGPLAEIALDAGYDVSGSDQEEGSMTSELKKRADVHIGQEKKKIESIHTQKPIDWFVYSSALPPDHPELVFAKENDIQLSKRDDLLAHIIQDKKLKLIAVAGTHGKTTTTAMLVWLFKQLNIPVSYSIGSTITFGASGVYNKESEYFVYECDEYDKNFLRFHPHISLITSVDYDHPDTYPTINHYKTAFAHFINQSERTVCWEKDKNYLDIINGNIFCPNPLIEGLVPVPGDHNRQNGALAATVMQKVANKEFKEIASYLSSFPGTGRRFEKLADNLYSDYGHHPVEIAATLQMARELNDRVALVYQPHQNIRQHEIKDQYTSCMEDAEIIYWLPTYLTREDPNLPTLTPKELTKNLTNYEAVSFKNLDDDLWQHIQAERKAGTLVLCMGAGSIDMWVRQQLNKS